MRGIRATVTAVGLLAAGAPLVLYGLFAILYRGDSGGNGDTYVTLAGHEIDADLVGGLALALGLISVGASVFMLRSRP